MFRLSMVVLSVFTTVSMTAHAIPLSLDLDSSQKDFYIAVSALAEQEGETLPDGAAPAEREGETLPDGAAPAEQEGETPPDGAAPAEQEGETPPDGAALVEQEGETLPDGAALVEQEGETAFDASTDDQLASIDHSLKLLVSLAVLAGSILFVWFFFFKPIKYFIDF